MELCITFGQNDETLQDNVARKIWRRRCTAVDLDHCSASAAQCANYGTLRSLDGLHSCYGSVIGLTTAASPRCASGASARTGYAHRRTENQKVPHQCNNGYTRSIKATTAKTAQIGLVCRLHVCLTPPTCIRHAILQSYKGLACSDGKLLLYTPQQTANLCTGQQHASNAKPIFGLCWKAASCWCKQLRHWRRHLLWSM